MTRVARRELLELAAACLGGGATLGSTLSSTLSSGAAFALVGCQRPVTDRARERAPGWEPTLFDREQALCVEDVAELIVPEGATPGAKSAGVAAFVESIVKDVYDEAEQRGFFAGLEELGSRARAAHGRSFDACTSNEQSALFASFVKERAAPAPGQRFSFVRAIRELTIRGFCNSKLGATRVLQYEPTPGEFQGCVPLVSVGKAWATG